MKSIRKVFTRHIVYKKHVKFYETRLIIVVPSCIRQYSQKPPSEDGCKQKAIKCLGEPPVISSKCEAEPRDKVDICQQGTLKVPPLPSECSTDIKTGPVYDKNCLRPYVNPCRPDISKSCKCNMVPHPCLASCERHKQKLCLVEPNCAYERKIDWGLHISQILLGLGTIIGGLILFRIYGGEIKEEIRLIKKEKRFTRPLEIIKIPASSSDIPDQIDYLLIGGGTAAYAAQKAIRSSDSKSNILVVSNQPPFKPAMRPPLSSQLWTEPDREKALDLEFTGADGKHESLFLEPDQYYIPVQQLNSNEKGGVGVAQGWTIKKLNPQNQVAVLDDGKKIKYGKCLLATGGRPSVLPPFDEAEPEVLNKVTFYRHSFDFQELEEMIQEGLKCICIVGGGLLGTELASSLRERTENDDVKIVNIVKDKGNLFKLLPRYLATRVTDTLTKRGVHVLTETCVEEVAREGAAVKLYVTNDKCVVSDHVIVATGIDANTDLANDSCLELDNINGGFLVNSEMQSCTGLYAAGDCASFYDCTLGRRRVEHHSFAIATGQIAGENMTGKSNQLKIQPSFKCKFAPDCEIEGTGNVNTSYPTVGVFPKSKVAQLEANDSKEEPDDEDDNQDNKGNGDNNHKDDDKEHAKDKEGKCANDPTRSASKSIDNVDRIEECADDDATLANQTFEKGVIYYLNSEQEIVGIVTLNMPGKIGIGKILITQKKKYDDINEITKLFGLHNDN